VAAGKASVQNCSHAPLKGLPWVVDPFESLNGGVHDMTFRTDDVRQCKNAQGKCRAWPEIPRLGITDQWVSFVHFNSCHITCRNVNSSKFWYICARMWIIDSVCICTVDEMCVNTVSQIKWDPWHFWHNFTRTAFISILLGMENLHLILK